MRRKLTTTLDFMPLWTTYKCSYCCTVLASMGQLVSIFSSAKEEKEKKRGGRKKEEGETMNQRRPHKIMSRLWSM
jgi:hypothetical protein